MRPNAFRHLVVALFLVLYATAIAQAQVLPEETAVESLTAEPGAFAGFRYASWRASNGDGVRTYALRFDFPLVSDQMLRLDLPLNTVRFGATQTISGFPGFATAYFKTFAHGQQFRFTTSVPSGKSGISADEWIVTPRYSISSSRGPFTFSTIFLYTRGFFATGPAPSTSIVTVSPGIGYSRKRLSLDVDYNISYDFAIGGFGSGNQTTIGPEIAYTFGNGVEAGAGYAFPISTIRDSRIFRRELYFNLGYRGTKR